MESKAEEQKKDIQGILLSGYPWLHAARYLLVEITDSELAKPYLNFLASHLTAASFEKEAIKNAVNIAFTSAGLTALDLPEKILKTFSREFIEGMHFSDIIGGNPVNERQILLGDRDDNDPSKWIWGNNCKVHCVLLFYSKAEHTLADFINQLFHQHSNKGLQIVYEAGTLEGGTQKEHFGFDDGISQPYIRQFKMPETEYLKLSRNIVNAGEFILGHKNEYDNYSPSPYFTKRINTSDNFNLPLLPGYSDKINLGFNGSYLVFRQLQQQVKKFWKYQYEESREDGSNQEQRAIKLAAKMVGRWPNGNALVQMPDEQGSELPQKNDFNFKVQDAGGMKCPFGAHIRRANPRDHVHIMDGIKSSIEMSNRHRMIRRGRIYGKPLAKDFDIPEMIKKSIEENNQTGGDENERGLHFICLVSDIQRQFEFVQNVWCNTPTFANLTDETDPIISPKKLADNSLAEKFTVPHHPLRNRYCSVPQFIKVVGGAYFFLPGIRGLRFICNNKSGL